MLIILLCLFQFRPVFFHIGVVQVQDPRAWPFNINLSLLNINLYLLQTRASLPTRVSGRVGFESNRAHTRARLDRAQNQLALTELDRARATHQIF